MKRHDLLSKRCIVCLVFTFWPFAAGISEAIAQTLPGTARLEMKGDIASEMIDGIDRFLLRQLAESPRQRERQWQHTATVEERENWLQEKRDRLAYLIGVRDERTQFTSIELVASLDTPAEVGSTETYRILKVRWPVLDGVFGEGLMLEPKSGTPIANLIAIPDADQTPEQFVGLETGVSPSLHFPARLAEAGCRVVVPALISREMQRRAPEGQAGRANMTNREFIYRPAFELGRHIIGYEVQKVLACVDWYSQQSHDAGQTERLEQTKSIGLVGYGEGAMLALLAAALDKRIEVTGVSGYFGPRETMWKEPLDRNIFGLLEEFGDAELVALIRPRSVILDLKPGPAVELPSDGGAPGALPVFSREQKIEEINRTARLIGATPDAQLMVARKLEAASSTNGDSPQIFIGNSVSTQIPDDASTVAQHVWKAWKPRAQPPIDATDPGDHSARERRQMLELERHTQRLLMQGPALRREYMKDLDTSSLENYQQSVEGYRKKFARDVIGRFDRQRLPFNARTRKTWETDKWTGYEVMLDVFPDVFAYGVLLLPKDLQPNEKRPVVVCQHGLEGRPTDTFLDDHRAYHDFAGKLCEQGFITFAPQNIYIFKDRFRSLQRKANPLGKTLFSIMVPQHQQIVDWLKTQPFVVDERIAFYGLSYGGKSAMRIPALVTDYCLSICSADFNEWVLKNASTTEKFSYVWTGEYEIFEYDLGSTFNYSEMAALICPRPFMVERGHFDGVGTDEWVAFEFAKVRNLYQARLGIGDRTEIEWFVGPHTIHGQGTFAFLRKHLEWPDASE